MQPDEPGKLIDLVGKILKTDVSAAKARLEGVTLGGPGFSIRESLPNGDLSVFVDIPVDPLAKP